MGAGIAGLSMAYLLRRAGLSNMGHLVWMDYLARIFSQKETNLL
jgi:hypothetical protein